MDELTPILRAMTARIGITPKSAHWSSHSHLREQLLARVRAEEIHQVVEEIRGDSALFDELVDELTIRETYFFRHAAQFELIRDQILPDLTSRYAPHHIFRCWSAGCSTGEEAYSLAILLFAIGFGNRSHVTGTDVSLAALSRARAGKYGEWSLRGEGTAFTELYLRREGGSWVVDDAIRRLVIFLRVNLAEDSYPLPSAGISDFDIILCRNVLIYFDERNIRDVAPRLFNSLVDGGWLLTAAADPILTEHAPFEVILSKAGLLYRRPFRRPNAPALPPIEAPDEVAIPAPQVDLEVHNPRPADSLALARDAFSTGDYVTTARLTRGRKDHPETCVLHLRALANLENRQAAAFAEEAIEHHPLCPELYYLLAHLRSIDGDQVQAILLLRKAIYLAPWLAVAHFMLGTLLKHSGDLAGARRHLRNAVVLAEARPSDEILAMSDGESAATLAGAARKYLQAVSGADTK